MCRCLLIAVRPGDARSCATIARGGRNGDTAIDPDVLPMLRRALLATLAIPLLSLACTAPGETAASDTEDDGSASAGGVLPIDLWIDETEQLLDSTAEWTNKVELADLDGDGRLDLLFANGGNYSAPGDPEMNRAFLNRGPGERFVEATAAVFGVTPDLTRVIKARDLDGDGDVDVFVGNTYQAPARLFLGDGSGGFTEVSATHLPSSRHSLGDAEPGDADGDGDLDLVLADWGPGDNMSNDGGRTLLWLNDGQARFTDATAQRMPDVRVRFSWDLEFVDVDNDLDLDIAVSCKRCGGSVLFRNEAGSFTLDRRAMPQYTNNYEFEPMDLDGDGYLDLVTINDGEIVEGRGGSRREHVFMNDGEGRYRDMTDVLWPDAENIGEDDNIVAYLDYDSDGDADFVIGSLSGPDRLLINDGTGRLRSANEVFSGAETPGTLGMILGDLDGDGRMDVVQAQGEHSTAVQERISLGRGLALDTSPPVVSLATMEPFGDEVLVRARVHDRKSPSLATEWREVAVRYQIMDSSHRAPMSWYGEYLWRTTIPAEAESPEVCATDASGNTACTAVLRGGG